MTVGIIVQARMTSKRFPGKVLETLLGKPVLQHVLERVKAVSNADVVVCAYPAADASRPIEDLCKSLNVVTFAGDEHDVLGRYWQAAKANCLDVVMRCTADCPFLNPAACGQVLELLLNDNRLDYASNIYPTRTFPKGLDCEAFTWRCLDSAHKVATDPYDREHVTPYIQRESGFNRGLIKQDVDESEMNLCIDYPEDIDRLEGLIAVGEYDVAKY
jgi:spore coat polysaccharide biosynthesis protein SpsF